MRNSSLNGGLSLPMSGVFGGTPAWAGSAPSNAPRTATEAAFGPGVTLPSDQQSHPLMPNNGVGVAFWTGVVAVGLLFFIRKTLPN